MNAKHDRDGAQPRAGDEHSAARASRRRFTRAGLATPVVLSSLASKPVLGAVPYHCTVSGQISGNISGRTGDGVTCVIGQSRSTWLLSTAWPTAITKGTPPDGQCSYAGGVKGTVFNGFQGLANAFFSASSAGSCLITAPSGSTSSMLEVLNSTVTGEKYDLGRAVVVSLLNAYQYAPNYPVTVARIVEMFNATYNGGAFVFNASVSWTRAQVITYLQSLYPPV